MKKRFHILVPFALAAIAASASVHAQVGQAGRLLASNCFQCHGTNGKGPGFEKLAGKSASELYKEMKEFQSGKEGDNIMARHVMGYTDAQLRSLFENAARATSVLGRRTDQIVGLIGDTNALLAQLRTQNSALDQISLNIAAVSHQLQGFIAENRRQLKPALDKLNGVLAIVDNRKTDIQRAIKGLSTYALSLGETVASGPFFKAYVVNLLPGQFVQPFVDAAFSDLGLDPATRLPSQLTDPQTGAPGTPPLPVPYPRTGQGGEPRMSLPDAITGNPGDPRYPYRAPLPAPVPGGPPPGPPAISPPGIASTPQPTPTPFLVPAPNEVTAGGQP